MYHHFFNDKQGKCILSGLASVPLRRQVNDKQNVMVRKQPNDMKRSIRSLRPKVQELPTSLELDLLLPTDT